MEIALPNDVNKLARIFDALGGIIESRRGTGEWVWKHPAVGRCTTKTVHRRRDPSRALKHFLRRLVRALGFTPLG